MDTAVDILILPAKHYIEMKYNNVPIDQVISKVMADLDISEESQRIDDYIEWASEAIELIGAPTQLETISTGDDGEEPLEVKGFQVRIPNDAVNILSVMYCDVKTGQYYKIFPAVSLDRKNRHYYEGVTYFFKPGYLCLNKEDGFIKLIYQRYSRDANGRILIPNLISYIEAVYWYIVMKISYPKWRVGQLRDQVYYDSKRSWRFFRNKAYGEMMMPSLDDLSHNIKNTWNKLVPDMTSEHYNFKNISKQEKVRF